MHSIKLTLAMLVAVLYVSATVCWFFWLAPVLLMDGEVADILYAFAGTCAWLLASFGIAIHVIKTARPASSLEKPEA